MHIHKNIPWSFKIPKNPNLVFDFLRGCCPLCSMIHNTEGFPCSSNSQKNWPKSAYILELVWQPELLWSTCLYILCLRFFSLIGIFPCTQYNDFTLKQITPWKFLSKWLFFSSTMLICAIAAVFYMLGTIFQLLQFALSHLNR